MKTDYRVGDQDSVRSVLNRLDKTTSLKWLLVLINAQLASYGVSPVDYRDLIVDDNSITVVVNDVRDSRFIVVVRMQLRRSVTQNGYVAYWTSERLNVAQMAIVSHNKTK